MRSTRLATVVFAAAAALASRDSGLGARDSRLGAPVTVAGAGHSPSPKSRVPSPETITHVLNRIGFGPAPGDVEEVRRIGLAKYIEQQLQPERIADAAMTARLAGFQTLTKSARELAEAFFIPAQLERRRAQQQQRAISDASMSTETSEQRTMRTPEQVEAMKGERTVLAELAQQKILRAAYSERQLEEVHGRFLVQPLQRVRRQRGDAPLPLGVRARRDPSARVRHVSRTARRDRPEPRHAVLSGQLAELRARRKCHDRTQQRREPAACAPRPPRPRSVDWNSR